jgi:DNA-binding transcriptional MerR regulator
MSSEGALPAIPAKRYFTIGEVAQLCQVKPHVLRYWEQEFSQLRPMKRRGNRRYYQHHEVLMVRRIRDLLYDQGFTISGARNKLQEYAQQERSHRRRDDELSAAASQDVWPVAAAAPAPLSSAAAPAVPQPQWLDGLSPQERQDLRMALLEIRDLLDGKQD